MKLEDQVTLLELSKKLKELGVKQESLFYHTPWAEEKIKMWVFLGKDFIEKRVFEKEENTFSAFTVAELGEMLPKYHATYRVAGNRNIWMGKDVLKEGQFTVENGYTIQEQTEADARAKMLIYLVENKLITL